MKFNVEIDCTPTEMREAFGLADVSELQQEVVEEMRKRLFKALDELDGERLMKCWLSGQMPPFAGSGGEKMMEQMQKIQQSFWDQFAGAKSKQ
ncbi:MAG: DUF6489 family protein [Pseudomonadota bacterium]